MTKREELLALAERCEAATGTDRELDCLIWAAVTEQDVVWTGADDHLLIIGGSVIGSIDPGKHNRWFSCNRATTGPNCIPAYTASLDAAMALATGFVLLHLSDIGADGLPLCKIGDPGTTPAGEWTGIANSLEHAVCAAALRARAAMESDDG